jgi:tetratricopeptide (TPR) repeat protein
VAEVEVSLLLARTRRERTLQLLVFEVGGRWQLAQCEAPWLAANARAALGVLGKSKGWTHEAVTEALDTAGVTWGLRDVRGWSHHDVFDRRQLRLPGYDLLGDDRLTARPRLPGLTPLSGKSPAPFSQQLREAPSLQTRLELCEAQIAASTSAGEVEVARAARLERARTRLALARRAVLADPAFELVPRIGAILAEDPTGLDGAAGEALRVRLYRAAGDPSRASLDEKAAEALASDGWCQIQAGRSLVTQEGKHNAAEVALWQSVNEARREGDRSLEAEALAGVAEAYWTVGQLERAQEALTAALTAEPATAPAQALRVLLALERLEPLTEELVAAAEVARRLDRCEPLAHLACVRVALARGDLTAADHALTLAQQAIAPWSQRHYQAALDLALAQGRRDLGHLLAEWGSRVDRLITEAEAAWLEPGGAAPSAATLAEIAQQTEPLTPRQRARLERLSDGAFAPTDMAGLRKVWQPVLLKDPGISTISERGDTLRIGVEDEAAAARVRALPGFLRHCERSNVPVLVEVVGRVRNLEAEEPPAPGAR